MTGPANAMHFVERDQFGQIFPVLEELGYEVVGPRIDQDAIIYDRLHSVEDLPRGWTDRQEPGSYLLERRDDDALFGFVVGPHSWKKYLFPPRETILRAECRDGQWEFTDTRPAPPRRAFLGVRACELAAIQIQDRVFLGSSTPDPGYQARRTHCLLIAVNCTQAASTCFCKSMETGPSCRGGFDLALTEIPAGFVIEVATPEGWEVLEKLPTSAATPDQRAAAHAAREQAVQQQTRHLDTEGLPEILLQHLDHPHWDDVAARCLSCTNCTLVCPTCFCSSCSEVNDLTEGVVARERQWDSCFNVDFNVMSGGWIRDGIRNRYRQWLTHKLATWHDQFGSSGCVGCGRCITWCPAGIDLTEEAAALREEPA